MDIENLRNTHQLLKSHYKSSQRSWTDFEFVKSRTISSDNIYNYCDLFGRLNRDVQGPNLKQTAQQHHGEYIRAQTTLLPCGK